MLPLTSSQNEVLTLPLLSKIFLEGPAGAGKTTSPKNINPDQILV